MQQTMQKSRSQVKPPFPQRLIVPPGVWTSSTSSSTLPLSSDSPMASRSFLLRFFGVTAPAFVVFVVSVRRARGDICVVLEGLVGSRFGFGLDTTTVLDAEAEFVELEAVVLLGVRIFDKLDDDDIRRGAAPRALANPKPIFLMGV